jgi:fused signal recognition particle receptor
MADAPQKSGWFGRLKEGLTRTSGTLTRGITEVFARPKIDNATLDDLEDLLIQSDIGTALAWRITEAAGAARVERGITAQGVRAIVADEVTHALAPVAKPLVVDSTKKPFVILVIGVNGSGKTTTIGKLAAKFAADGKRVAIAAGDTFRAAAVEQLGVWAERARALFIKAETGADAAGLAFQSLERARAEGSDVLLIDTAGRLQNRGELMAELGKIIRAVKKLDPSAPHATLLVLDATVGQNAISQVDIFGKTAGVTGLVMTKLDGTARGGILVAIADKFGLPIHFVGVGESIDDLEPFAAKDFARALVGLDT